MTDQQTAPEVNQDQHQVETDPEMPHEEEAEYLDDTSGTVGDETSEQMRGLVIFLASHLVDEPEHLDVRAERRGSAVHLQLRVPSDQLGKVIGRQGRVARAMRTALTIAGARHNVRTSLDIEE